MYDVSDVILAIASPPGRSLRGIVRASGEHSLALLQRVISVSVQDQGSAATYASAGPYVGRLRLLNSRQVPVVVLAFHAPHSYTGEHSFELQMPGNPALLERAIESHLAAGRETPLISVRRAHPGEFTARAFFNHRLTLTQAEGVAAIIAAQSDAELKAAQLLTAGSLGTLASGLANELALALALVEAGIDFTDQDEVVAISPHDLLSRLNTLGRRIADQLSHAVGAEQLRAIPWVVLRGRPNAGKSALFNALLGRSRAVVSAMAGTTRDVLTEPLAIRTSHGQGEVMLIDLAGLDQADASTLNRDMQQAAAQAVDRADLVLWCQPVDDHQMDERSADERTIIVRTKSDLLTSRSDDAVDARVDQQIAVSAYSGHGLAALRQAIAERLSGRAVSLAAGALALQPRHEDALRAALHHIHDAQSLVQPQCERRSKSLREPELVAAAMRAALDSLSALAGDITPDDVLGRIFASFCIGK